MCNVQCAMHIVQNIFKFGQAVWFQTSSTSWRMRCGLLINWLLLTLYWVSTDFSLKLDFHNSDQNGLDFNINLIFSSGSTKTNQNLQKPTDDDDYSSWLQAKAPLIFELILTTRRVLSFQTKPYQALTMKQTKSSKENYKKVKVRNHKLVFNNQKSGFLHSD